MTDDPVAVARRAYERFQQDALAASPLAEMGAWVASGRPPAREALRSVGFRAEADEGQVWLTRKPFVREWGFAIPCAEAVRALVRLGPLLEIGAGSGAWAAMLAARGVDVTATDFQPAGEQPFYGFTCGRHFPVSEMSAPDAVRAHADRNVFCSWPAQDTAWDAEAALAVRPGRFFALISDGPGGTSGTPQLFQALDRGFRKVATLALPQFPRIRDRLVIYRRRSQAS